MTPTKQSNTKQRKYITGQDRNDLGLVHHLYDGNFQDPGKPLCARGWNREDGWSYSIFRNCTAYSELCKVCERRAKQNKDGVEPKKRKTKWI